MKTYKLYCLSFDGDSIKDSESDNIEELQGNSADMGPKWFFYPFHFITTERGKIIDSWSEKFNGRYLKTIKREFKTLSDQLEELQTSVDCDTFALMIAYP